MLDSIYFLWKSFHNVQLWKFLIFFIFIFLWSSTTWLGIGRLIISLWQYREIFQYCKGWHHVTSWSIPCLPRELPRNYGWPSSQHHFQFHNRQWQRREWQHLNSLVWRCKCRTLIETINIELNSNSLNALRFTYLYCLQSSMVLNATPMVFPSASTCIIFFDTDDADSDEEERIIL